MITNPGSKTRVDEVGDSLVVDEEPLLFHTGPRRMFPLVREAVAAVLPVERLRHVGFSHFRAVSAATAPYIGRRCRRSEDGRGRAATHPDGGRSPRRRRPGSATGRGPAPVAPQGAWGPGRGASCGGRDGRAALLPRGPRRAR